MQNHTIVRIELTLEKVINIVSKFCVQCEFFSEKQLVSFVGGYAY